VHAVRSNVGQGRELSGVDLDPNGIVRVARLDASQAAVIKDFERLSELLRLDAVGVAVARGPDVRIHWWGAPGSVLPDSIDEMLAGTLPGWIVAPLPSGATAFARLTTQSSTRTPAVLQAIGPLLAASLEGDLDGEPPLVDEAEPAPSGLDATLNELRSELGFETASLFVRGARGWELLARTGPVRAWHAVLDPAALGSEPRPAEYADVRTVPGVGTRLARLGCASAAVLPVLETGCVVLDSSVPCPEGGWIERARPFLALLSVMAGPGWSAGGALRAYQEVAILDQAFGAIQDVMARPGATVPDLLDGVQDAVGATELFLLVERGPEVEVAARNVGPWPSRLSRGMGPLTARREPTLSDEAVRQLAADLGIASSGVTAAVGRDDPDAEVLVAGWADGLMLSPVSMSVVARAVSTGRAALLGRRQAVVSLIDRERTRMAYALHDGLVQIVVSAVLELEALKKRFERDPATALESLDSSKAEIRRSLAELRSILFDLSRSTAEEEGAPEPITRYVEDVVRRWRLPAQVAVEGNVNDVPSRTMAVAYVVVREAMANAAKHAGSGKVEVRLTASDEELFVSVHDGGRGFTSDDERAAREAHHFGLEMLRRRVREAGGELSVESRPGRGTEVVARLPFKEERP
jgi:signal transduction histidine kinase